MADGDMYVANCTRQNQIVYFRIDFDTKGSRQAISPPKQMPIPAGQQVMLTRDQHPDAVKSIVDQLTIYGMKGMLDLQRGDLGDKVIPFLFDLGRPLKLSAIKDVMDHNHRVKIFDGKKRREDAAIASNNMLERTVEAQLAAMDPTGEQPLPDLKKSTVDFETAGDPNPEEGRDKLAEGFVIDKSAPAKTPPAATTKRGPGRPRKRAA